MSLKDIWGRPTSGFSDLSNQRNNITLPGNEGELQRALMASQQALSQIRPQETLVVDPHNTIDYAHQHEFIVNWANGAVSGDPYCKWCKRTETQCVAQKLKK